jgi:hypothetical protein
MNNWIVVPFSPRHPWAQQVQEMWCHDGCYRTSAATAIQLRCFITSYPCHEHSNHHTKAHMDKDATHLDSFYNR